MSEFTSIPTRPETRERIKSLKSGGETYDEVLNRLLEDGAATQHDGR